METQTVTLSELIGLTLFLGSIVFLLGAVYQTIALVWLNNRIKWYKIIGIILLTRILTLISTILLWKGLFQSIERYHPIFCVNVKLQDLSFILESCFQK
mgnify:CR=1 FL=1